MQLDKRETLKAVMLRCGYLRFLLRGKATGQVIMGKQSKWKDVEFAPGDFASNYSPDFILDVCEVVMNSAKEAISKGDKEILLSAIRALYFPDTLYGQLYLPL